MLATLNSRITSGLHGEIRSLLVVRHGMLVMEEYYRGSSRYASHQVYSVTKSVTSALIGIAVEQHLIPSLQTNVFSYFPEHADLAHTNPQKQSMTIEHLLTMTSGLEWDELSVSYNDSRNPITRMMGSPDWIRFVLAQPMVSTPGAQFKYNSGCSVLLGEILKRSAGKSVSEYARERLFNPLGIYQWEWEPGSSNITNTGWGLHLRPRDMARIGLIFLDNGAWHGQPIVSASWVQTSTSRTIGTSGNFGYGYQWWMMPLQGSASVEPKPDGIKVAWGWGDQFIFVVPSLDLVVVSTANNKTGSYHDEAIRFVPEYVIKAVIRP